MEILIRSWGFESEAPEKIFIWGGQKKFPQNTGCIFDLPKFVEKNKNVKVDKPLSRF